MLVFLEKKELLMKHKAARSAAGLRVGLCTCWWPNIPHDFGGTKSKKGECNAPCWLEKGG